MSIWKRAMDYLGLGPDDAYDDYDMAPDPEPRPSRPEAIRFLLRDSLTGLGYLGLSQTPEWVAGRVWTTLVLPVVNP